MYAITKIEKNRTKIPNKLKATLFFSQSSLEELLVSTRSLLKCLWISVEKSCDAVGLEKSLFDIEINGVIVECLAVYILGEPKRYPMTIEFDNFVYGLAVETQTVILFLILYMCTYLVFGL